MPQVTIYSTSTCPYCGMLKTYLTQKGAMFTEKLVDQDDSAREEMMRISNGFLGVPFSVVKVGEVEEKIIGFDKGRFDAIFK